MSANTKIEWADSTFNSWSGCTNISPACDHCYAEALSKRAPKTIGQWGNGAPRRRTSTAYWKQPLRWNARPFWQCGECGWRGESLDHTDCPACRSPSGLSPARRRVFCASLADVFDNEVDPGWRADLFDLFDLIANTPNLDWLLLTKRIGNAADMINAALLDDGPQWPWPNIWLGATICNQAEADRDVPKLLATPAARRFLSIEPMLGPVDLMPMFEHRADAHNDTGVDWIICGGESGPQARPMHPDWARSLRDQCAAAGVPFLFKQWGEWAPAERTPERDARITMPGQCRDLWAWPDGTRDGWRTGPLCERVGKKAAGRLLDGVEHNGVPA